jgi:alpha-tubulin suppressor-like RCC1 family protein
VRPHVESRAAAWAALAAAALLVSTPARAEPTPADAALAETLFREAKRRMAEGDHDRACPMLAESQRLDPGGGTLLALALCHEAAGKTASAWVEFEDALTVALRDHDASREAVARQHIASLEPRLSRLQIVVSKEAGAIPGLTILRDGKPLAEPSWALDAPVDPGEHTVLATAPGRAEFRETVVVGPSADSKRIAVPMLAATPPEATRSRVAAGAQSATSSPSRWPAAVAYGTAALSAGALVVGGAFFLRARDEEQTARDACPSDACSDRRAVALDAQAKRDADRATVALGIGLATAAASAVLFTWGDRFAASASPDHAAARLHVRFLRVVLSVEARDPVVQNPPVSKRDRARRRWYSLALGAATCTAVACADVLGAGDLRYHAPDGSAGSSAAGFGGSAGASMSGASGTAGMSGASGTAGMSGASGTAGMSGASGAGGAPACSGSCSPIGSPGAAICTGDGCACGDCSEEIGCVGGTCGGRIRGGTYTPCAMTPAGTLYCWGNNQYGQLGAAPDPKPVPLSRRIDGLPPVRYAVSTGYTTCALTENGEVYCWGSGNHGELGSGADAPDCLPELCRTSPVKIELGQETVELTAGGIWFGGWHYCARSTDRRVRCWGQNTSGELGGTPLTDVHPDSLLVSLEDVVQVAAGVSFTCARTAGGEVFCWGTNGSGTLGQGDTIPRLGAHRVKGLSDVILLGVGGRAACALTASRALYCWGNNDTGQVGAPVEQVTVSTPVEIPGAPADIVQIAGGYAHTCVLTATGAVHCWGRSASGALGDGDISGTMCDSAICKVTPVKASIEGVVEISAGDDTSFARKLDGTVWAWGQNGGGQLGQGTAGGLYPSPVVVPFVP